MGNDANETRRCLRHFTGFQTIGIVGQDTQKSLADCIFNYLAVTAKSGLRYSAGDQDHHLRVNVDASFAPPHEGFKSVHGVFICRGSHPLHWCSAKAALHHDEHSRK